ncbi:unnamed protein product [Phaeothamnion confervicola]
MSWHRIESAPEDVDLELAVIDSEGPHALVFPCRRTEQGWVDTNGKSVPVHPTHWRKWMPEAARQ